MNSLEQCRHLSSKHAIAIGALLWLFASLTMALQSWVGDRTIYADSLEQRREEIHQSILNNQAPGGGSWAAAGAQSIQKRVGIVYLAEGIRKMTGWTVGKVYKLLDSIFLFASMFGLFLYLRRWLSDSYCLIGVLYFCAVLPLTYFFQLFHPWDRLQLLMWIVLLYLVAERKFIYLLMGLFISITIKFDTILMPVLYFAVHFGSHERRRLIVESLVLFATVWCVNLFLNLSFPDPLDTSRFSASALWGTLSANIEKLMTYNFRYPPLLSHFLPIVLALIGLRTRDRFILVSVWFGLTMSVIHLLLTNYEETRAHMMVVILVMPAALMTVRELLEPSASYKLQ
jgi:hypothetical protein